MKMYRIIFNIEITLDRIDKSRYDLTELKSTKSIRFDF